VTKHDKSPRSWVQFGVAGLLALGAVALSAGQASAAPPEEPGTPAAGLPLGTPIDLLFEGAHLIFEPTILHDFDNFDNFHPEPGRVDQFGGFDPRP
jgi:hypothetical protein